MVNYRNTTCSWESKMQELVAAGRYAVYRFPDGYRISRILAHLNTTQWWRGKQLAAVRHEKFRHLVGHAVNSVPFYRRLAEATSPLRELAQMPVIEKDDLRGQAGGFRSERAARSRPGSTGGSTGEPLRFLMDRDSLAWAEAAWLRGRGWAGIRIGDRAAVVGSSRISTLGRLRQRIVNIHPLLAIGSAELATRNLHVLRRIRPKAVNSFATVLATLAETALASQIEDLHIPVVFTTGEKLFDHQRDLIQRAFGSDVRECYGSNEVGGIAYECDRGSLHISDEHVILEVLNENGEAVVDEVGDIVVTDLDNYAMPFIRYRIGDRGVLSSRPCDCGRALQVLSSIEGREQEFLVTMTGRRVPAISFPCLFRSLEHISRYQIVQHSVQSVTVRFVPCSESFGDELQFMIKTVRAILGNEVTISAIEETEIERTPHGKTRYVVCEIPKSAAPALSQSEKI